MVDGAAISVVVARRSWAWTVVVPLVPMAESVKYLVHYRGSVGLTPVVEVDAETPEEALRLGNGPTLDHTQAVTLCEEKAHTAVWELFQGTWTPLAQHTGRQRA